MAFRYGRAGLCSPYLSYSFCQVLSGYPQENQLPLGAYFKCRLSPLYAPVSQKELYAQFGWHYITSARNVFYIFANEEENPAELHTDPVAQSSVFERLYRHKRNEFWGSALLIGFLFVVNAWTFWGDVYDGVLYNDFSSFMFLIYLSVLLCFAYFEYRSIRNLKKQLDEGIPMPHTRDYRKQMLSSKVFTVFFLVFFLTIFVVPIYKLSREYYDPSPSQFVEKVATPLPYLPIDLLENTDMEGYQEDTATVTDHQTFLAPQQIAIYQQVETGERTDDGEPYRPYFMIDYYTLKSEGVAKLFARALAEKEDSLPVESNLFDRAYEGTKKYRKSLCLQKGDTVINLTYNGKGDLKSLLDEAAELLEKDYTSPVL